MDDKYSYKSYMTYLDSEGTLKEVHGDHTLIIDSNSNELSDDKILLAGSVLPDEYEPLVFIEMNGECSNTQGQVIDMQYVAGANMIFNLRANMTAGACGTSTGNDSKTIFAVSYSEKYKNGQMMLVFDETGYNAPTTDASWTGLHEYTIDYLNNRVGCDGVYQDMGRTVSKYANKLNFTLGAWNESDTYYYRASGKFYQLRITTGTTQQMNAYAAMRKSDNVVGMYDIVGNRFLTNIGTGSLGYLKKDGTYVSPSLT